MTSLCLISPLTDIGNLLIVLLACGLSVIVPPLGVALWLGANKSLPNILLLALVLGLTTQGILGFICNHYLHTGKTLEITIYFLGWLIATVIISLSQRRPPRSSKFSISREDFLLIVMIILAVAVRSIYPLQHLAL